MLPCAPAPSALTFRSRLSSGARSCSAHAIHPVRHTATSRRWSRRQEGKRIGAVERCVHRPLATACAHPLTSLPPALCPGPFPPQSSCSPAPPTSRPTSPPSEAARAALLPLVGAVCRRCGGPCTRQWQRRERASDPPVACEWFAPAAAAEVTGPTGQRSCRRAGSMRLRTCTGIRCCVVLCQCDASLEGGMGVIPHPRELVVASKLSIYIYNS